MYVLDVDASHMFNPKAKISWPAKYIPSHDKVNTLYYITINGVGNT